MKIRDKIGDPYAVFNASAEGYRAHNLRSNVKDHLVMVGEIAQMLTWNPLQADVLIRKFAELSVATGFYGVLVDPLVYGQSNTWIALKDVTDVVFRRMQPAQALESLLDLDI